MAKIVYRQMPAPRDLPQTIPRQKLGCKSSRVGANFRSKSPGVRGGWLWQKLIATKLFRNRLTLPCVTLSGQSDIMVPWESTIMHTKMHQELEVNITGVRTFD